MRLVYILYGFGILFSVAGIGFLAAEYVKFMTDIGKLLALLLTVAMFASLSKYFESLGW